MERETDRVHVREEDAPAASIHPTHKTPIDPDEREISRRQQTWPAVCSVHARPESEGGRVLGLRELPGIVLFFLGGGCAAAVGAPWPDAAGTAPATPGSAAASCCCGDISGLIWSCWSPSLTPKNAAADEFDAITTGSRFILAPPARTRQRRHSLSFLPVALARC